MKYSVVGFVILGILFTGCAKKSGIRSEKGVLLTGFVYNVETGNPVKSVDITLISKKDTLTLKSPTGKYIFDIEPGLYTLVIEKKGFEKGEQKLRFSKKKEYSFDYILLKERVLTPEEKEAQEHLTTAVAAFNTGDVKTAKNELSLAKNLDPKNPMVDEYMMKVDKKITTVVDSLYKEGLALESAKKNKEALAMYENILTYDPAHTSSKERIEAINKLLAEKPKPKPKPKDNPKPKPTVNVDAIYQQGISLFSQGKYKSAISKFNTVLKYKPGHSGAKSYRAKAQKRLKALGG
jgi:tetratricopeptide (TPR) repeat protein